MSGLLAKQGKPFTNGECLQQQKKKEKRKKNVREKNFLKTISFWAGTVAQRTEVIEHQEQHQ